MDVTIDKLQLAHQGCSHILQHILAVIVDVNIGE